MIVCACAVVRSHEIEAHVAGGATTVEQVAGACGAGARCGGCRAAIARMVSSAGATGTAVTVSAPSGA